MPELKPKELKMVAFGEKELRDGGAQETGEFLLLNNKSFGNCL